jgi:hypothetical protein
MVSWAMAEVIPVAIAATKTSAAKILFMTSSQRYAPHIDRPSDPRLIFAFDHTALLWPMGLLVRTQTST